MGSIQRTTPDEDFEKRLFATIDGMQPY